MEKMPLICIVGPTASGKTGASIALAKRIDAEIVSTDSVQVYRHLDIGTAKPTLEERQGICHHMIDCVDPGDTSFSVSQYFSMASDCIRDIWERNRPALVVGGSGLYVQALTQPLNFAVPSCPAIRQKWEDAYDVEPDAVVSALCSADPVTGARLHRNDKKRIVRAMEVFECSGRPLSAFGNDFHNEREAAPPFPSFRIGLTLERDVLYRRIDRRVDLMMERGLLAEARALFERRLSPALPAMQSIGYRQLFRHFSGEWTLFEAVEAIKQDTRRFAKRQMTWFRRDAGIHWLDVSGDAADTVSVEERIWKLLCEKGMIQ